MKQEKRSKGLQVFVGMIFFCFVCLQLPAQPGNAIFRNISSAEGLPSTSVTDITQDAFGFFWIGTWEGVSRYDGRSFKKIPSSRDGRYLVADKKGGVWISLEYSIGYYDPYVDSVKIYEIPKSDRFADIAMDNAGNVWVSSTDGMLKFDPATDRFKKEKGLQSGIVTRLSAVGDGVLLFLYREKTGQPIMIGQRNSKGVYTMEPFPADENNPDKEKLFYQWVAGTTSNLDNWPPFISRIDSSGVLIINRYGWAYRTGKDAKWIFKGPHNVNLSFPVTDAKLDLYNNIWLIQENGLTKLDFITGESTSYKNDPANPNSILPMGRVLAGSRMFFDRQGVLWIACFSKGISRLNLFESDFGLLKDSTGAPIQDVLSALELKDGSFWIGVRNPNNGLYHYNAEGKIIKRYGTRSIDVPPGKTISTELSHPFVWSLAETADGSIWAGGGSPGPHRGGLNRIRPGTNAITRFKHDPGDTASLTGDFVFAVRIDGSGGVWAISTDGLSYIDPLTEKVTNKIDIKFWLQRRNAKSTGPLLTSSGDLLIGDQNNFTYYLLDHKTLSLKPFATDLAAADSMVFVHQDDANRLWFVNRKGFGYLDPSFKKIGHFYELAKLALPVNETPIMFNSDKKGNIWMATENGIIQFDPVTEKYKHFGFERGLQGNQFVIMNYRGPSGKFYFGGNGGINIFDPEKIKTNPFPPEMLFTHLKLDGKTISFGKNAAIQKPIFAADKITVEPGVLTISIDFAAIHFANNKSNRYQYKLEGFDKNWRDGGFTGNANYTNLPPGTYTLFIKGSNWDGVWSDGTKSIRIIILPPWWQTWWAYTLYGLIFLFLLWRFIKYQKERTIRKERERTQQRELAQAKEIEKAYTELKSTQAQLIQSEKMASLGELTAGIAHEIQNPLNFVNNFSELNTELIDELKTELTTGNMQQAIELANDIKDNEQKINHHGKRADAIVKGMLQHSRSSSSVKEPTDINALADEYLRLAYHGLRAKDKTFNAAMKTDFDTSVGMINVVPQDIGRVILNLITNAFYVVTEKKKAPHPLKGGEPYEPTVTVTTKRLSSPPTGRDGGKVLISVKDNGNGIPQKLLDKIFQPFFTTKPTGEGTGLGLSLSYDIVKAHGGEIIVETKEGEGTVFIINLPA